MDLAAKRECLALLRMADDLLLSGGELLLAAHLSLVVELLEDSLSKRAEAAAPQFDA